MACLKLVMLFVKGDIGTKDTVPLSSKGENPFMCCMFMTASLLSGVC